MSEVLAVLTSVVRSGLDDSQALFSLRDALTESFVEQNWPELLAADLTESWLPRTQELLERELLEWVEEGLPRPLVAGSSPYTYLGTNHPQYDGGLSQDFADLLSLVSGADPKFLLLLCAAGLYAVGATRILVVDGPGDGGVDVLGLIEGGSGHGLLVAVQAKSSGHALSKHEVQVICNRFSDGLSEPTWRRYREALRVHQVKPGVGLLFMLVSLGGYGPTAVAWLQEQGTAARTARQLADLLSRRFTCAQLQELHAELGPLGRDLNLDLFARFSSDR